MKAFLILTLSLVVLGCTNSNLSSCKHYWLLWPSAVRDFRFQKVALPTLSESGVVRGPAAQVYTQSQLTTEGYRGRLAQPRLTRSGNTCVPTDTESATALTVYGHFEKIQAFENQIGIGHLLTWPRKVGIEIQVLGSPDLTHNNAHYYSREDVIAIVPFNRPGELPIGLNPGILAHEHFHAHFQRAVLNVLNKQLNFSVERTNDIDLRSIEGVNNFVLRAWNEGLADFYAAVYMGDPAPFATTRKEVDPRRDLSGRLGALVSGRQFYESAASFHHSASFRPISYITGTSFARVLYQVSLDLSIPPEHFLKHLILRLERLPALLARDYRVRVFDIDEILPVLLAGLELNDESCALLENVMSRNHYAEVSACWF